MKKATMAPQKYEALLKTELECFKCHESFKTIPQLKHHLQKEWEGERAQGSRKNA
jgi:aprataxin